MANDDFFNALDEAEAAGGKILESKDNARARYWYEEGYVPDNENDAPEEVETAEGGEILGSAKGNTRVRYWYEEGYVPGNEKDPEEEEGEGHRDGGGAGEAENDDDETGSSSGGSTVYEEVVPRVGGKHGGRRVRWGGFSGKLALTDGMPTAIARYNEVLDELLLPGMDSGSRGSAQGSAESAPSDVTAIVLAQLPEESRSWSYRASCGALAIEDEQREEEEEATKVRFAIEDGSVNAQVRSEEEHAMAQWAKCNDAKRQEARRTFVAEIQREEQKKRTIERGSREQLPGTRKPLPLSQAWQERKANTEGKKLEPTKSAGRSMLPCSLSSSSSSSFKGPAKRLPGGKK